MRSKKICPDPGMFDFDVSELSEDSRALLVRLQLSKDAVQIGGIALVLPMLVERPKVRRPLNFDRCSHARKLRSVGSLWWITLEKANIWHAEVR